MSSTDSVEISANLGGSIAGIVDASVAGTCGHTWSTGHSFTTGVTNTPYQYATISGRINSTPSGVPPVAETNTISFGSGNTQTLHVGGFGPKLRPHGQR